MFDRSKILALLALGKVDQALDGIVNSLLNDDEREFSEDDIKIIALSGQIKRYKTFFNGGIISPLEFEKATNRIELALLRILNKENPLPPLTRPMALRAT